MLRWYPEVSCGEPTVTYTSSLEHISRSEGSVNALTARMLPYKPHLANVLSTAHFYLYLFVIAKRESKTGTTQIYSHSLGIHTVKTLTSMVTGILRRDA